MRITDSTFNRRVGAKLRAARQGRTPKLGLEQLGKMIGKDAATVARYETGDTPLTCVMAAKICQALGTIEMVDLFREKHGI